MSFVGSVNGTGVSSPGYLKAQGLTTAVLQVLWGVAQPEPGGALNPNYIQQLSDQISAFRAAGLDITLDPGLQYPPQWALDIPGAQFIDQYGDVFTAAAASGEHAVNAIYNPSAQQAEENYLALLATALGPDTFRYLRVGGLLTGELRMPSNSSANHRNSWWAYSSTFQASSPVAGYRPGISPSSPASDAAFLSYYLKGLADYETFLVRAVARSFAGQLEVMLPSYGIRPGDVQGALASGLDGTSVRTSELAQGVDFAGLLTSLATAAPELRSRMIAYSTWLDGPEFDESPQGLSPIGYIASIAGSLGIAIAGENTASSADSAANLALCKTRAARYQLRGLMWFGSDLATGGVTARMLSASS